MLSEYYQSQGKPLPSVQERSGLYSSLGLGGGYSGTAEQNNALEAKLRAGSTQNNNPTTSSTVNVSGTPATNTPSTVASTGGASAVSAAPSINLTDQYNKLLSESGVSDTQKQADAKQAEIDALESAAADERAKIGENPFLSEAALNGRIAKIDKKLNEKTAVLAKELGNLQGTIQSKKDEVNNKLGLTVQQYNIDKASRQENLSNFNTLLSSKALVNATAEDIATLAAQTGLAPSFIQSAIQQSQIKEPQIITQTDENGNVSIISIDKTTGDILKNVSAGNVGKGTGSGTGTTSVKTQFLSDAESVSGQSIDGTWVGQFPQLVMKYAPMMSLDDIYKMYLTTPLGKKYGTPKENPADIKSLYDQARGA